MITKLFSFKRFWLYIKLYIIKINDKLYSLKRNIFKRHILKYCMLIRPNTIISHGDQPLTSRGARAAPRAQRGSAALWAQHALGATGF